MMPSREHFLLKRRSALSRFSFSPTLIVDIFNPPSPQHLLAFPCSDIIAKAGGLVNFFAPVFRKNLCAAGGKIAKILVCAAQLLLFGIIARIVLDEDGAAEAGIRKAGEEFAEGKFDYVLVNDDLETAFREAEEAVGRFIR